MQDAFSVTVRRVLVAMAALGFMLGADLSARAQQVVVFVNGEPITTLDIEQRSKLTEISTHKAPPRQEVLDELIDEKLKLQVAKKYGLEITDKDIDNAFGGMARRAGLPAAQFAQALGQSGVNVPALKRRIKADLAWSQIVRGKFPSITAVGEKDIVTALAARKPDEKDTGSFQYSLRPILFIVPRGSAPAVFENRRREADGLRARFQACEQGVQFARALTDVAVRESITRLSTDIPVKQREILDSTQIGHLTAPEITQQGVEMFAVCARDATRGDSAGKAQIREEMIGERYNAQAKRYLQELRCGAMIDPSTERRGCPWR